MTNKDSDMEKLIKVVAVAVLTEVVKHLIDEHK